MRRIMPFGMSAYMPKPVVINELIVAVDVLLILSILLIAIIPVEARFVVVSKSDRIVYELKDDGDDLQWGEIVADVPGMPADKGCAVATISTGALPRPLTVTFTGGGRQLAVEFSRPDDASLGRMRCRDGRTIDAPSALLTRWVGEDRAGVTLAISGTATIGGVPARDTVRPKVLKEGTLTVEASAPFGGGHIHEATDLRRGDEVHLLTARTEATSYALISMEGDTLDVVARAVGRRAEVVRYGQERGDARIVAPNFFDKMRSQSEWAALLVCCAILLNLLGAARALSGDALRSSDG